MRVILISVRDLLASGNQRLLLGSGNSVATINEYVYGILLVFLFQTLVKDRVNPLCRMRNSSLAKDHHATHDDTCAEWINLQEQHHSVTATQEIENL